MSLSKTRVLPGSLRGNLDMFFDMMEHGQMSKEAFLAFKRRIYRQCEAAENIVDETVMHKDTYADIIAIMGDEEVLQPVGEAQRTSRRLPKLGVNVVSFPVIKRGSPSQNSPKTSA